MTVDRERIEHAVEEIIKAIGEDPGREGLVGTPGRYARFLEEFIDYDSGKLDVSFESVQTDQMVVVKGMRVYSLCEHHLLPFGCRVSVAYITGERVLGLSKFGRLVQKHAHALQLQERLVHLIADDLQQLTGAEDVAVYAEGEHMCMVMRGVRLEATMCTSVMRGVFLDKPEARAEFLSLVKSERSVR